MARIMYLFLLLALLVSGCNNQKRQSKPEIATTIATPVDTTSTANDFVQVDVYPEMIDQGMPEYPTDAKRAGLTGVVWVKVLVDKLGNARQCVVAKTSRYSSLDKAAVAAGLKCRFKPGIQQGKPVVCWATFKYEFKLNDRLR